MKNRYVKLFEEFLNEAGLDDINIDDLAASTGRVDAAGGEGEKKKAPVDPIKKLQDEEKQREKEEKERFKKHIQDKIKEVKDILDKYPEINDNIGKKVINAIDSKDRTLIHTTKNDLIYMQVNYNKSGQTEKVEQLSKLKEILAELDRAFSVDKMM